jgi:hypothetical protein
VQSVSFLRQAPSPAFTNAHGSRHKQPPGMNIPCTITGMQI